MKTLVSAVVLAAGMLTLQAGYATQWQALPEVAPAPADNPTTPEKVELGRMLYMDPRFSSTGTVSCNSCHNVMLGGEDNRSVSMGVHGKTGGRSAPTVWNSAFSSVQFWDGRAADLVEQAKGPVLNPIEMGMANEAAVLARLEEAGYGERFEAAMEEWEEDIASGSDANSDFERWWSQVSDDEQIGRASCRERV